MRVRNFVLILFIFLAVVLGFFYKVFIYKYVPFPGDLLVSEYSPWKYSFFLGYNPGSYPNKAQYFDVLRQMYPWKTFVIESFKGGNFPLWNPYNFSGAPILANFQSGAFYFLNFLYFLIPQIWAWSATVMLQPLLALLFTFYYARKIGISRMGSAFASFSFGFSSFMSVWLEYNTIGHVILWLPLVLLSLEKLFDRKTVIWSFILVFSLSSSLFAGHIQIFFYLFVFAFIYSLMRLKKISFFLSVLFVLSLGIGAVQLVPGIELILNAARSAHTYDVIVNKILLQGWQLAMLFVPDFFGNPATRNYWIQDTYIGDVIYVGLIPLFFIFFALFTKKNYYIKLFIFTLIGSFILITRNPLTELIYRINIPLISGSGSNLLVFIVCFSLSMLSGFGLDAFLKNKYLFKKYLLILIPLILIFVLLWIIVLILPKLHWFSWENNLPISFNNLLYSTAIFVTALSLFLLGFINSKFKKAAVVLLIILTLFDLWRFFHKFNPFSPGSFTFPQNSVLEFVGKSSGINRFWGYKSAHVEANIATQFALFSPEGYDPLYLKRYGELIQASYDGKIQTKFTDQTRSDAVIAQNLGELRIMDLLGVKYVLDRKDSGSTQKDFPVDRFSLVFEKDGWKVFENLKALPRIFLASDYKVFQDTKDFEKLFFAKNFNPSKTILLEKNPDFNNLTIQQFNNNKVDLLEYKPNKITISSATGNAQLLFLSDTHYPGWKAYVDDKEVEILRANYAFRSIVVPAGDHKIKFIYDPLSFKFGYAISLLSVGLLVIVLIAIKKIWRSI